MAGVTVPERLDAGTLVEPSFKSTPFCALLETADGRVSLLALAKYSALIWEYFCHSSGSWSSAKQASTGQASTQASQSMHSSGSM